jgi:hypothetical protein
MASPTKRESNGTSASGAVKIGFYLLMIGLALVQVFVSFRGLRSASGMETAQLAREVARGNGWSTKCIRPAAWRQAMQTDKPIAIEKFTDTSMAPLPVAVLVPLFKALESKWTFDPSTDGVVYLLDRVVAGLGALWFLLTLLGLHGLARRLFDDRVANITVVALGFSQILWEMALSGSPRMLLLLELVWVFRCLLAIARAGQAQLPYMGKAWILGFLLTAMMLTHWMGSIWTVAILLCLAFIIPKVGRAVGVAIVPVVIAIGLWMVHNQVVAGDPLGSGKILLQAALSGSGEEVLARTLADTGSALALGQMVRGTILRLAGQTDGIYGHLALLVAAPWFFAALLHRFRRPECGWLKWTLTALVASSAVGMALIGPLDELFDDGNVFPVLAPLMSVFGVALILVLWTRLEMRGRGFWQTHGAAVLIVALTAAPMLAAMPDSIRGGLMLRGQLAQWPPYAADRVSLVPRLIDPQEVVMSDAPWFIAWYADIPSIWLPVRRDELTALRQEIENTNWKVAGVVITPVSARCTMLGDIFNGSWSEWPDVILRGPVMALDREIRTWQDFPYQVPVPLVGFSAGDSESLGLLMVFYTDRQRTLRPKPGP